MTEQCGQCEEAVHVTDSNDLECDQAYYNRCTEDIVLDPDCHYILLESQSKRLTQMNLKDHQSTRSEQRRGVRDERTHHPMMVLMDQQESDLRQTQDLDGVQ